MLYGLVQIYAGFLGISFHFGIEIGILAVIAAIFFRFTLPVTIGAFFGAMDVWGWHWFFAALFAAPTLVLMIPGILGQILSSVGRTDNFTLRGVDVRKNNKMALTGFILSLVSIFTFQLLVIPLLGVVFSAIGLSNFNPTIHKAKWMAIAGLIIGILYTLMGSLELLRAVGYY